MRVSVPPPQSLAFDVSLSSSLSPLSESLPRSSCIVFLMHVFPLLCVSVAYSTRSLICLSFFSVSFVYFTVLSAFVCVCVCVHQVSTETPSCCCLCMVRAAAAVAVAVAAAAAVAAILLSVVCRLLHPMFISYVSWTHVTDPRRN